MPPKALIRDTAIILLVLIVLLAGTEMVARLAVAFPRASFTTYRSDPATIYSHRPNSSGWELSPANDFPPAHVRYDRYGFRGAGFDAAKAAGERRVFVLGDSIVEARQVGEQDTLSARLETGLRRAHAPVRVVNAGVSAYTTTTANLLLRDRILALEPDIVVYLFFANDYADNFVYGNYTQYDELLAGKVPPQLLSDMRPPSLFASPLEWAKRNSAAIFWITWLNERAALASDLARPDPVQALTADFRRSARSVNKADLDEGELRVLEFTHRGIAAMAEASRRHGTKFLLAVVPFPPQVDASEWKSGKRRFGFAEGERMEGTLYQQRLAALAAELQIPLVDLLPAFRDAHRVGPLFFEYDGHLTPWGHETVARALEPKLLRMMGE